MVFRIMSRLIILLFSAIFVFSFTGCSSITTVLKGKTSGGYHVKGKHYVPMTVVRPGYFEDGVASWYGPKFNGRKTASGEVYNMHELTAAHKTLPMNSLVTVTNLDNKKTVTVRINDRGPFIDDRIIDLSLAAAKKLDLVRNGTGSVRVTVIGEAESVLAKKSKKERKHQKPKGPNPYFSPDRRRMLTWKKS